jgi:glycine betaine/proline transport system substrate-binding protein
MRYLLIATLLILTGCSNQEEHLEIVHGNYPIDIVMGAVVKAGIEKEFGIPVKITHVSSAYIFSSLSTGMADISTSIWLPTIHQSYYESLKDRIELHGKSYNYTRVGLAVKKSLPINSIKELRNYGREFEFTIYGVEPGAGLSIKTEHALDLYCLSGWSLMAGSDATMFTALKSNDWTVITGWEPHEMHEKWDLKFLDDPENVFGGQESIYSATRKNFKVEYPEISAFLKRFHLSKGELQGLLDELNEEGSDPYEIGRRFYDSTAARSMR